MKSFQFAAALVLLTLLAAGLRLHALGRPGVWIDELHTVRACAEPQCVPPVKRLGHVATAAWLRFSGIAPHTIPADRAETWRAAGLTEARLRLPACLIGILTIPLLTLAGRRLLGAGPALAAGLLLAVAPWHIEWSQAARFYTQQFLFYNLALLWYLDATQRHARGRLLAAAAALALAVLTQPTALILGGVLAADWILSRLLRRPLTLGRTGWIAFTAVGLGCVALLSGNMAAAPEDWINLIAATHQSPLPLLLGTVYMTGPAVVVAAAAGAWTARRERPRIADALTLAAVLPPLVLAAASTGHYVALRYVLICLYPALALAALALDAWARTLAPRHGRIAAWGPAAVLLVSVLFTVYVYFTGGNAFHRRWKDAFAYVRAQRRPHELVCAGPSVYNLVARYYLETAEPVRGFPKTPAELRALDRPVWLVFEAQSAVEDGSAEAVSADWIPDVAELKAYFALQVIQPVSTIHVYRYVPPQE
jgi:hypothetical protein